MIEPVNETIVDLARAESSGDDLYADHVALSGLVRTALLNAGLGRKRPEAPLADLIEEGMTVLLKPNWVLHTNQSGQGIGRPFAPPAGWRGRIEGREVKA